MAKTAKEKAAAREALKQELREEIKAEDAEQKRLDDAAAAEEGAADEAAADAAAKAQEKTDAEAQAAAEKKVAEARTAKLDPFNDKLTKLVADKKITPAQRRAIEDDLAGDDSSAMITRHLDALGKQPVAEGQLTGPQTGGAANPVMDWINRQHPETKPA